MRAVLLAALLLLSGTANACILYNAKYHFDGLTEVPHLKSPAELYNPIEKDWDSPSYIVFTYHAMIEGPIMVYQDEPGSLPGLYLPTIENEMPALVDWRGFISYYRLDGKTDKQLKDALENAPETIELFDGPDDLTYLRYRRECVPYRE